MCSVHKSALLIDYWYSPTLLHSDMNILIITYTHKFVSPFYHIKNSGVKNQVIKVSKWSQKFCSEIMESTNTFNINNKFCIQTNFVLDSILIHKQFNHQISHSNNKTKAKCKGRMIKYKQINISFNWTTK